MLPPSSYLQAVLIMHVMKVCSRFCHACPVCTIQLLGEAFPQINDTMTAAAGQCWIMQIISACFAEYFSRAGILFPASQWMVTAVYLCSEKFTQIYDQFWLERETHNMDTWISIHLLHIPNTVNSFPETRFTLNELQNSLSHLIHNLKPLSFDLCPPQSQHNEMRTIRVWLILRLYVELIFPCIARLSQWISWFSQNDHIVLMQPWLSHLWTSICCPKKGFCYAPFCLQSQTAKNHISPCAVPRTAKSGTSQTKCVWTVEFEAVAERSIFS